MCKLSLRLVEISLFSFQIKKEKLQDDEDGHTDDKQEMELQEVDGGQEISFADEEEDAGTEESMDTLMLQTKKPVS